MENALKKYLKSRGMSQGQFARALGVRPATVSVWVNGGTPRPEQMRRIAETTGGAVPVTAWFERVCATGSAA